MLSCSRQNPETHPFADASGYPADHIAHTNGRLFVRELQMSTFNLRKANLLTIAIQ